MELKKGAYTELIGIGSIVKHIHTPFQKELLLLAGSFSQSVKADIVNEHLA